MAYVKLTRSINRTNPPSHQYAALLSCLHFQSLCYVLQPLFKCKGCKRTHLNTSIAASGAGGTDSRIAASRIGDRGLIFDRSESLTAARGGLTEQRSTGAIRVIIADSFEVD